MIKEKTLKKLGFTRTVEQEPGDQPFHYYTLEIGNLCLISNDNEDAEKRGWLVEFFDHPNILIRDKDDLKTLVKILERSHKAGVKRFWKKMLQKEGLQESKDHIQLELPFGE